MRFGVRKILLWLGIAAGVVLGTLAVMAMPTASVWQSPGGEGEVIDLTGGSTSSGTRVPEGTGPQPTKPRQQAIPPSPGPRRDGLATGAEPIVILNSGIVTHNAEIVARGFGFEPYEDVLISLYSAAGNLEREIGLIGADKEGNFTEAKFGVGNELAPGEHVVVAVGQKSGAAGRTSFRVQPSGPWLALDSYSEKPYAYYTFNAGGFDPGEQIAMHFDSVSSQPIGTAQADEYGMLSNASARVPMLAAGEHSFILVGQESRTAVSSPFTVLGFYPWVGLTNYSPQPQQRVGFIGHDFAPGERVAFFLNDTSGGVVGTVVADENGNFETEGTFEVPVDAVGEVVLVFLGSASQMPVEVTMNVLPFGPLLELSTYAGPPGTRVSLNGQGFARNEVVHVYIGKAGGREVSSFTADEEGKFSGAGEFAIPFDVGAGSITLTAVGDSSGTPIAMEFAVLEIAPWASLSEYNARPGTIITFGGNGFGLGEVVNIYVGSDRSKPIATAQADENGAFAEAGPYVIPEDAEGKVDFTFVGEQSKATATATFTVAEPPVEGEGESEEGQGEQPPAGEETPADEQG